MILTHKLLAEEIVLAWKLWDGSPLDAALVNPASVDLRLGPHVAVTRRVWGRKVVKHHDLREGPLTIRPGEMALVHSMEYVVVPPWAGAFLTLKSSRGREGWDHAFAGWFDPGFEGTAVFEVYAHAFPLTLELGKPFAQLIFLLTDSLPETDYSQTGRYQGQVGPQGPLSGESRYIPSKVELDGQVQRDGFDNQA